MNRAFPLLACLLPLAIAACQLIGSRSRESNPPSAPPIDTARVHLPEVATWGYKREVSADLDGDEKSERIVIAANVSVGPAGPLWEDGHLWAVYAENAKGERTLLYGAFVPRGFTEAAVLGADDKGRRLVLIQERTPEQIRAMEVEYKKPGSARLSSDAHYRVGEWLPGSASLR